MNWNPVSNPPLGEGSYLVFMPERSLDRYSVQHWSDLDGWSNDFGIRYWMALPPPPEAES